MSSDVASQFVNGTGDGIWQVDCGLLWRARRRRLATHDTTVVALLVLLDVLVLGGNALVVAALLVYRRLRTPGGMLIASLSVADFLVGLLVLPLAILDQLTGQIWILGGVTCQMWTTVDIWLCTASIYNLVAISLDRYLAIVHPLSYFATVTTRWVRVCIALVWLSALAVCLPPVVFQWHDATVATQKCRCTVLDEGNVAYVVYSSVCSFFLPMAVVIAVYLRIYSEARAAISRHDLDYDMPPIALPSPALPPSAPPPVEKPPPPAPPQITAPPVMQARVYNRGDIHRDVYAVKRQDPLMASIRRLRKPAKTGAKDGSSEPARALQRRRSSGLAESAEPIAVSVPHILTTLVEDEGNSTQASTGDLSNLLKPGGPAVRRTGSARMSCGRDAGAAPGAVAKGGYVITPEMLARYERLNMTGFESKRADPLAMSIRKLRTRTGSSRSRYKSEEGDDAPTPLPPPKQPVKNDAEFEAATLRPPEEAARKTSTDGAGGTRSRIVQRIKERMTNSSPAQGRRLRQEIKAARTVAVVTGCFIACWLGFSMIYAASATDTCQRRTAKWGSCVPPALTLVLVWLGYANSALNPIIYTALNKDFRCALRKLLSYTNVTNYEAGRSSANGVTDF